MDISLSFLFHKHCFSLLDVQPTSLCTVHTLTPQPFRTFRFVPGLVSGTSCNTTIEPPTKYNLYVEPVEPLHKDYHLKICLDGVANVLILNRAENFNQLDPNSICSSRSWFDFNHPRTVPTKLRITNLARTGYFSEDKTVLLVNGKTSSYHLWTQFEIMYLVVGHNLNL